MPAVSLPSYEDSLSTLELDAALERLVDTHRRCEWLLCRYLADMAEGSRFRELGWFSDVLHYAKTRFSLSVKITRERIRIGRALRGLPRIEAAFVSGQLSYSKVRELTRVADADSERMWLETASRVSMRELERRVSGQLGAEASCDDPADVHWRTPDTVRLEIDLPAGSWALLSRAMEGARLASETAMSDAQALEAVAREALCRLNDPDSVDVADPRRAVVLYQCDDCGHGELETTAGAVALPAGQAQALSCGAKTIDLATEGQDEACVGGCIPAAVRRAVLARDRGRCRVCGRRRYVDVHHIEPQSEGGAHSRDNCCVLCTSCHGALHEGRLRLEGDAETGLRWCDEWGEEIGSDRGPAAADEPRAELELLPELSAEVAQVLKAMDGRGGWHVDALVSETGLSCSQVSAALMVLELTAKVVQQPWGKYSPKVARPRPEPELTAPPMGGSGQRRLTEAPNGASVEPPMGGSGQSRLTEAAMGASVEPPIGGQERGDAGAALIEEMGPEIAADCDRVLAAMAGRGGWHTDALVEETGLSGSKTASALMVLELAGRIRDEGWRTFAVRSNSQASGSESG